MGSLSAANSKLCFDVFKEMNYDHMIENLIFSPLSLLSALAVVLFGARGDSASQMEKVPYLIGSIKKVQKKYLDCIEQLYKLKPENLDFKNNNLLLPNSLTSSDQLVLVNVISFRGTWKYAFQKDQTTAMAFRLDESQSKPVQMMRLQGHFKLDSITEPRVQVLEVPDVEDHLSMVIVLPREEVGLGQLRLHGYYEDLTSILAALGMTDVFNHSRTNLSGITAGGDLRVSKIIHKAMLEVIETGSEFTLNNQTSKFENPELFKVDHPFLFFIFHKETKMILFYGRVCNP
eukprot:bmy_05665T0